ncbi:hypothetical protein C8R43DRAFT_1116935 [Mycena crocata]|nr:hypothetical protein C8R43DRAFT_1116935 [Mycena crocata]
MNASSNVDDFYNHYSHSPCQPSGAPQASLKFRNSESHLSDEKLRLGVSIGDVGLLQENGMFDFFVQCLSPCEPRLEEIYRQDNPPGTYAANGFKRITPSSSDFSNALSFQSIGTTGAICGLPSGSTVEKLLDLEKLRQYAISNAENWYRYAIVKRGRIALNGSLYIITQTEKSDSWGTALVMQRYQSGSCIHLIPDSRADGTLSYHWIHSPSHATVQTNLNLNTDAKSLRNQTLFIKGLKIGLGKDLWRSATKQRHLDGLVSMIWRWPFWFADAYFATFKRPLFNFHPSVIFIEYLLGRAPSATVVVTHDDDIEY